MSTISNISTSISQSPLRDVLSRMMAWFGRACEHSPRVQARRAQIAALEAKSDDELARLGIPRDQIAYHVFRDLFYT